MMRRTIGAALAAIALLAPAAAPFQAEAAAAGKLADGIYKLSYEIRKAENESVSMANDYFEKPATIIVSKGVVIGKIQLNHSEWITEFKTARGDKFPAATVLQKDAKKNTRVVQFRMDGIQKPLVSKIHVTVPDIEYDHDYTIRFVFDADTIKKTGTAAEAAKALGSKAK
ncbi:NEAT domain-containing protein [Paenibacillus sp. B01]|uniref:NEAT domain-containing protein n=1 Tax=Paenibacillus sp. B01 TaxID=2660554 RepID=UPI0018917E12|nr:NEAT domain-containing protein [Paenibacillus sp. B01]